MSGPVVSGTDQVDRIMAVMAAAFDPTWGEAWNRRQVSDALMFANTHAFVVDPTGELIDSGTSSATNPAGFVLARYAPGEVELLLIAVDPRHRRQGLGQRLIALLREHARGEGATSIFLEMRENNPAAQLYHKMGFDPIGRRKAYYLLSDGTRMDAITFALPI